MRPFTSWTDEGRDWMSGEVVSKRIDATALELVLVPLKLELEMGGAGFSRVLHWQTFYLYTFALWAGVVAFLFPLLFGFA